MGILGDDTIIVVSSDNGGSVWFGGLNAPLRSGKHTSFEGGVRVPAFALDLSGGLHLGPGGIDYPHMVHVSDWLPTFLQAAGEPGLTESKGLKLDGLPLLNGLRTGAQVRSSVLWTCTLQLTLMMGGHWWLIGKETIRSSKVPIRMPIGIQNQRRTKFQLRTQASLPGFWKKLLGFWTGASGRGHVTQSECFFSTFGCSTIMRENGEVKKILCFSILRQILRKKEILPLSQLALLQNFWQKLR